MYVNGNSILIDLEDDLEDEGVVPPSGKSWVLFNEGDVNDYSEIKGIRSSSVRQYGVVLKCHSHERLATENRPG